MGEGFSEMTKYNNIVEAMDQGAVALVVDVADTIEKVQPTVVWAWAVHFGFCAGDYSNTFSVQKLR